MAAGQGGLVWTLMIFTILLRFKPPNQCYLDEPYVKPEDLGFYSSTNLNYLPANDYVLKRLCPDLAAKPTMADSHYKQHTKISSHKGTLIKFNMATKPKSYDDDSMNFEKLEKELKDAVNADQRYWRENDAKFRAVHQKVATYDEFKDIVKASHIKPLEKGDKMDSIVFNQPWNIAASRKTENLKSDTVQIEQTNTIPKNGQEFVQYWRRYLKSGGDQYIYLLSIGGENLSQIFKTEISFGLLGDIINALYFTVMDNDLEEVIKILEGLSQTNRFALSLQFLSSTEKETTGKLLDKLLSFCENSQPDMTSRVMTLHETYGLKR